MPPIPLIEIGSSQLYTSPVYENDAVVWPNDSMLIDEWAEISELFLNDSGLVIEHYIDGRATAEFAVYDASGSFTFYERQQVLIKDVVGDLFFAGVLQKAEEIKIPGQAAKIHSISAADYTAILEWRLCDYAAEDTLAGDAVRAIMNEYLAEEGITEGYIEDGELLTEIAIGNKSVAQAFAKLAEACNFVCYIGYDYKLYFHARTLYAAEWNVSDGTDILSETFEITRSNENYRNTETVIGGYEETSLQTEYFIGDGSTKSFPLAYPANRFYTVTLGGVNKTIGVKGTDAGSYDCYYAVNSETLAFETAPANGATIEAKYYGLWRAKSKAEDLTAISNNATRQGFGSGKVEHITIDESLTSITAAGEYASAKLAEYARDGIQVVYKTRRSGLAAGTLQAINLQGINEDFLITHITEEHKSGDTEYTVEACFGPVDESWELYFRDSFTAIYTIREGLEAGTGVTKLYNFSHTYEDPDRPNPFKAALPGIQVSDDSWPCFALTDRTEYIEFWRDENCIFRKQHTLVVDEDSDEEINSYSFVSPGEALGEIDEVLFFGGDKATSAYGSGKEIYRANFVKTKTILESYQINMEYLNGA